MAVEMNVIAHDVVSSGMTPGERRHLTSLEKRIERGLAVFREVGEALMEIRDSRLYRETHATFEAYCRERWQIERARAYQLIGAVEVVRALGDEGDKLVNEAQARELVTLVHENPELVPKVWEQVTAGDAPVSAPRIREVIRQHMLTEPEPEVTLTTRLVDALSRVEALYRQWLATDPSRPDKVKVGKALRALGETAGLR